jgi:hypothetical protein
LPVVDDSRERNQTVDWFAVALLLPITACALGLAAATFLIRRHYHRETAKRPARNQGKENALPPGQRASLPALRTGLPGAAGQAAKLG